ncbi:cytidine deaminase [Agathobaculum butyriciproducens]|uniref:cytidine deaminase n=1 Tax=Agathobaculum butyriciproducens TaxID=1628085 RepID=UPI0036D3314E
MAQVALERHPSAPHFGAVIVKNDVIVSTGYNGEAERSCQLHRHRHLHSSEDGHSARRKIRSSAARCMRDERHYCVRVDQMIGATLYLVGRDMSTGKIMSDANSCTMCKRLIINAGIEKVLSAVMWIHTTL